MRIVCWNPNRATWSNRRRFSNGEKHLRSAWSELADLAPDIALVQEAAPPTAIGFGSAPHIHLTWRLGAIGMA